MTRSKNGQRVWGHVSPKKVHKGPISTQWDTQHHSSAIGEAQIRAEVDATSRRGQLRSSGRTTLMLGGCGDAGAFTVAAGEGQRCGPLGDVWQISNTQQTKLPHDPAVSLGTSLRIETCPTKVCTQIFIAAKFKRARSESSPNSHRLMSGQTQCGLSLRRSVNYSATKQTTGTGEAVKRMPLENMTRSERAQVWQP